MKVIIDTNQGAITSSIPGVYSDSNVILLVQGDNHPNMVVNLTTESYNKLTKNTTETPINLSGSTVRLNLKPFTSNTISDTLSCLLLPGLEQANGSIVLDSPYDQPGVGGRVLTLWNTNSLNTSGLYEGEFIITYLDGTIQRSYNLIRLNVRPHF